MKAVGNRNRRSERTQAGLLTAFRDLLFSRGYEALTVGDIVEHANVGRSTFYEHYENKDDLFRASLGSIVPVLADAVCDDCPSDRLVLLLRHFCDVRELFDTIVGGAGHSVLTGYLAQEVELRLARSGAPADRSPTLPLPVVAAQIAASQCGLLLAWLAARGVPAERAAESLTASSRAIAAVNGCLPNAVSRGRR